MGGHRARVTAAAEAAAAALAMVGASPRDAQDAALEARRVSRRQHDRAAESVAGRALGLARKELGDLAGARAALRDAVRVADQAGLDRVAAEARMSLAFVLLDSGRVTGALAQADRAVSALRGAAAAQLRAQRGLILQRCGRLTEAQAAYQLALPVLARAGDRVWEARLRNNRGLLRAFQGSLTAAEADLRRAAELHTGLGNQLLAADCTWNLGFVAARRGDAPAALACYDATEATYREAGVPAPELLLDRAEVLLSVGLNGEAAAAAAEAAGVMARLGCLPTWPRPGSCRHRPRWPSATRTRLARTPTRPLPRSGASNGRAGHLSPGTSASARPPPADRRTGPRWRGPGVRPMPSAMPAGPRSPWTRGSSRPRRRSRWVAPRTPRTSCAEQRGHGGTAASPCASRPGTPRSCCAWRPVGAAPSAPPCAPASAFSTSTARLSARRSCACTRRRTGPGSLLSVCGSHSRMPTRSGC